MEILQILALWISIAHLISNAENKPEEDASSSHASTSGSNPRPIANKSEWEPAISRTSVELSITEIFLANHDVTLKLIDSLECTVSMLSFSCDMWMEKYMTQVVFDNNVPKFNTRVTIIYRFEQKQLLKIAFYGVNSPNPKDYPLFAYFSLGELVRLGRMIIPLKKNILDEQESDMQGYIVLDIAKLIHQHIRMQLSVNHLRNYQLPKIPKLYIEIDKYDELNEEYDLVYNTKGETASIAPNEQLRWKEIIIHTDQLCDGEFNRTLKFSCWDPAQYPKRLIGQFLTTLDEISNREPRIFDLINEVQQVMHSNYTNSGQLRIDNFKVIEIPSLATFIKSGLKIYSTIAVDFADGDPQNAASLHYRSTGNAPSRYENMIASFARILEDFSETISVKGFGAQLSEVNTNHNSNVILTNSLDCIDAQGVLQAYRECSENDAKSTAPAHVAPVIREVVQNARKFYSYFILLILSDRNIEDVEECVKVMLVAHTLPISIIIIGSGDDQLKAIGRLNPEDESSSDATGERRHFFQYLPFNKYSSSTANIFFPKEVLATVEKQIISYIQPPKAEPDPMVIDVPI